MWKWCTENRRCPPAAAAAACDHHWTWDVNIRKQVTVTSRKSLFQSGFYHLFPFLHPFSLSLICPLSLAVCWSYLVPPPSMNDLTLCSCSPDQWPSGCQGDNVNVSDWLEIKQPSGKNRHTHTHTSVDMNPEKDFNGALGHHGNVTQGSFVPSLIVNTSRCVLCPGEVGTEEPIYADRLCNRQQRALRGTRPLVQLLRLTLAYPAIFILVIWIITYKVRCTTWLLEECELTRFSFPSSLRDTQGVHADMKVCAELR